MLPVVEGVATTTCMTAIEHGLVQSLRNNAQTLQEIRTYETVTGTFSSADASFLERPPFLESRAFCPLGTGLGVEVSGLGVPVGGRDFVSMPGIGGRPQSWDLRPDDSSERPGSPRLFVVLGSKGNEPTRRSRDLSCPLVSKGLADPSEPIGRAKPSETPVLRCGKAGPGTLNAYPRRPIKERRDCLVAAHRGQAAMPSHQ